MDSTKFSKPISLKRIQLDGGFWKPEMELVRKEVIPYQWETLNDRVPDLCAIATAAVHWQLFHVLGLISYNKGTKTYSIFQKSHK